MQCTSLRVMHATMVPPSIYLKNDVGYLCYVTIRFCYVNYAMLGCVARCCVVLQYVALRKHTLVMVCHVKTFGCDIMA